MGFSSILSTTSQLLTFDRRTCIALGIISQTTITLGGNTILVDFMVIEDPLEFNMLLERDYVYAMQAVVSTLIMAKKLSLSISWIFLILLLTQLETRFFLY